MYEQGEREAQLIRVSRGEVAIPMMIVTCAGQVMLGRPARRIRNIIFTKTPLTVAGSIYFLGLVKTICLFEPAKEVKEVLWSRKKRGSLPEKVASGILKA